MIDTANYWQYLAPVFIGLATGLLSGTFGVGGGIVATPLLRLCLGMSAHEAIGTTLSIIFPTSLSGTYNYYKLGLVDVKFVRLLIIPAVLATFIGAQLTTVVQGQALMLSFAGLILLAGSDLVSGYSDGLKKKNEDKVQYQTPDLKHAIPVGLAAGLLSGFFGVGGGFIMIPMFLALFSMPVKMALGTSLLAVACIAIPGTLTHLYLDHVRFAVALPMVLGAIPGSILGSKIALKTKDSSLKKAFGYIMLAMATTMILSECGIMKF